MNSFLITGGNDEERAKKAKKLITKYNISQFDTYTLEPELSIGIAEIRELERWLSLKPYQSEKKAVIIYQAEKLTLEAQNALLKSLEEPPTNTLVILLAPTVDLLLPTIVSRCQVVNLSLNTAMVFTEQDISQFLNYLNSIFSSDIGEKFRLAQEISKQKEAIYWLEKGIAILESLFKKRIIKKENFPPFFSLSQYLVIIQEFQKTKLYIQANVNPRVAIENLFLKLPKI